MRFNPSLHIFILLLCTTVLQSFASDTNHTLNVLSFNIRYNNSGDGPNAWMQRKHYVSALIQFHQADVVGLQEALLVQLKDLQKALPDYRWFGVGRDDGKYKGEHTAIIYRTDKLKLLSQGTFWCSSTPNIPSRGWDGAFNRTVTWARFSRNNDNDKSNEFFLFNTHFDHKGIRARAQCAKLMRKKIDDIVGILPYPVVVTGDFNTPPASAPYTTMTENKQYVIPFYDAAMISKKGRYGPVGTFTGFDITATNEQPIDYIFVNNKVVVNRFGVLSDSFDGKLPSDHYPLIADLTMRSITVESKTTESIDEVQSLGYGNNEVK